MRTKQLTILAIASYSKGFGVAVFSNSNLLHFAVCKYYDRRFDVEEDLRHATELIDEFMPTIILVKALTARQLRAKRQIHILDGIKRVAGRMAISFTEVDLDNAKQALLKDRDSTLGALFTKVGGSFPEVSRMASFQNRSQREYYTPLLSAVAIGASFKIPRGFNKRRSRAIRN